MAHAWPLLVLVAVSAHGILGAQSDYYGKYIGKLKTLHHGVTGEVFAVDGRTLHIRDFSYDGEGPAAYFYAGDSKSPNSFGFRVNDEKGTPNVLSRYRRKHITLTLPDNKTLRDIKWFSVWCDEFSVNFGDVRIPKNLDFPKPQKIDALAGVHLVSSDNIVVVDAQTLLIPGFSYDGEAPDAKFWVGRGSKPSPQGTRVPDENGKEEPLRRYDHKTIVLTLPGDTTVFDIGHFGVWCEAFTVDFGHIKVPRNLNVPPSLKMLGVSPQKRARSLHQNQQQLQQQLVQQQQQQQNTFGRGVVADALPTNIDDTPSHSRVPFRDDSLGPALSPSPPGLPRHVLAATTYRPSIPVRRGPIPPAEAHGDDAVYRLVPSIDLSSAPAEPHQPRTQHFHNPSRTRSSQTFFSNSGPLRNLPDSLPVDYYHHQVQGRQGDGGTQPLQRRYDSVHDPRQADDDYYYYRNGRRYDQAASSPRQTPDDDYYYRQSSIGRRHDDADDYYRQSSSRRRYDDGDDNHRQTPDDYYQPSRPARRPNHGGQARV